MMNRPLNTTELKGAASTGPRLVLFVEEGGCDWHARRLRKALEARGATVVTRPKSGVAASIGFPFASTSELRPRSPAVLPSSPGPRS